jgi:hypothetical protein
MSKYPEFYADLMEHLRKNLINIFLENCLRKKICPLTEKGLLGREGPTFFCCNFLK